MSSENSQSWREVTEGGADASFVFDDDWMIPVRVRRDGKTYVHGGDGGWVEEAPGEE